MKATIQWTKIGDGASNQRQWVISVPTPVEHGQVLSDLQEQVLQVPQLPGEPLEMVIEQPISDCTDGVVAMALEQERHRRVTEIAEGIALMSAWASGESAELPPGLIEERYDQRLESTKFGGQLLQQAPQEAVTIRAAIKRVNKQITAHKKEQRAEQQRQAAEREKVQAARQEQKQLEEQERVGRRKEYVADWVVKHGSDRLQQQLAMGLKGWPLYLHERLVYDLGVEVELDNDGDTGRPLDNPSEAQMDAVSEFARRFAWDSSSDLAKRIVLAPIAFPSEDYEPDEERLYAVAEEVWRPGPEDLYRTYNVRVEIK